MAEIPREEFKRAYRKEKDPRVVKRMAAVNMAHYNRESAQHVADSLMQCPNWVLMWVRRFEEGGIDALRDLPRSGRPPRIDGAAMDNILSEAGRAKTTPAELRQKIWQETGILHHITYVRKLMYRAGLSVKTATLVHASRAGSRAVNSWRHRTKMRIARLKRAGFAIAAMDESFFIHNDSAGRKYWSPIGVPVRIPHAGGRRRLTVFDAVTDDGRQLFRTTTWGFNNKTFIPYVRALLRRFKRVALILDRAPTHRSRLARKTFGKNKNVEFIYLPKASPYLNASEQCWHRGKNDLLNSEYYETFDSMRKAVSAYLRTVRFDLDVHKYLSRKTSEYA